MTTWRNCVRTSMMATTAVISMSVAGPALAQTKSFKVPAQSAANGVASLARQADVQLLISARDARGKRTNAVEGSMTVEEAIRRLLEGTGLRAQATGPQTFTVISAPSSGNGEEAAPANETAAADATIIVTGSRIANVAPTSPVVMLDQDYLQKSGAGTVEEAVRTLPQNFSSLTAANSIDSADGLGAVSLGNGGINLRGLGADATLVLINGRRTAGSGSLNGEAVNISTIPLSAVERIDVLTDGASAIYGSDAIGGVVNIILKKNSGFSADTHARYENSSTGGHAYAFDQSLSFGWQSGNINASVGYRKVKAVDAAEIGFTTFDYRDRGGFDQRGLRVGQPGLVDVDFFDFFALPIGHNGLNFTRADLIRPYLVDANGNPVRDELGNEVLSPNYGASSRADFLDVSPETKTLSARFGIEQELGSHIKLFGDFLYSKNKVKSRSGAPDLADIFVPASNAFNGVGQDVFVGYSPVYEVANGVIPADTIRSRQERIDIGGGAEFRDFLGDWTSTISVTSSRDKGQFVRTTIDTSSPAFDAAVAASNPSQAINLFGNGTAQNNAVLASLVSDDVAPELRVRLLGFEGSANGSLFHLPGGDVRMAFGGEHRREKLDGLAAGLLSNSTRDIDAAFGELAIPVFGGDFSFPGMNSLLLTAAARWEKYTVKGDFNNDGDSSNDDDRSFDELSPKIGLRWEPFTDFTIMGTWSRSFRAPTATSLFGTNINFPGGIFSFRDPLAPGGPANVAPPLVFTPNLELRPETSTSWTASATWKPSAIPGLRASVGYNKTDFKDRLTSGFDVLRGNPEAVLGSETGLPGFTVERNAAGNVTRIFLARQVNAASRKSESVDFSASYTLKTDSAGEFLFGISGVRTINVEEQAFVGSRVIQLDGTTLGPSKWVLNGQLGWSYGSLDTNVFVRHSSSYTNTFPNLGFDTRDFEHVDGYTTVDLNVTYNVKSGSKILDKLRLSLGARNLFDADFPFVDNSVGPYDPTRVDVRGRVVYFDVTKSF